MWPPLSKNVRSTVLLYESVELSERVFGDAVELLHFPQHSDCIGVEPFSFTEGFEATQKTASGDLRARAGSWSQQIVLPTNHAHLHSPRCDSVGTLVEGPRRTQAVRTCERESERIFRLA